MLGGLGPTCLLNCAYGKHLTVIFAFFCGGTLGQSLQLFRRGGTPLNNYEEKGRVPKHAISRDHQGRRPAAAAPLMVAEGGMFGHSSFCSHNYLEGSQPHQIIVKTAPEPPSTKNDGLLAQGVLDPQHLSFQSSYRFVAT